MTLGKIISKSKRLFVAGVALAVFGAGMLAGALIERLLVENTGQHLTYYLSHIM